MGVAKQRLNSFVQVGIVAGGTAIYSACQWLMLAIFTRAATQEAVGAYTYALAVSAPFFVFFAMSLRQVYVSDAGNAHNWRRYLTLRVAMSAVAAVLSVGFAALNHSLGGVYVIVAAIKAVDLIGDIYLAPAQARGNVRALGAYQALNGLASVLLFGIVILLGAPPALALGMSFAGSAIAALYALVAGRAALRHLPDGPEEFTVIDPPSTTKVLRLALTAAPLGMAGFLNSVTSAAPRYFLQSATGLATVAVFSAMAYLVIVGNTIVGAVIQYELPRTVTVFQNRGSRALVKRLGVLTLLMLGLGALAVVVVWFAGDWALEILYGPGYSERVPLLLLTLSWAVGAVSWVWDMGLVVCRGFKTQMGAAAAGTVFAVACSWVLVPQTGLEGAALATLGAMITVAVFRLLGLRIRIRQADRVAHG